MTRVVRRADRGDGSPALRSGPAHSPVSPAHCRSPPPAGSTSCWPRPSPPGSRLSLPASAPPARRPAPSLRPPRASETGGSQWACGLALLALPLPLRGGEADAPPVIETWSGSRGVTVCVCASLILADLCPAHPYHRPGA